MGEVGDLSKLILAKENQRDIQDLDSKLKHELADCLWSVIVLTDAYDVNLEEAFAQTMDDIEEKLKWESQNETLPRLRSQNPGSFPKSEEFMGGLQANRLLMSPPPPMVMTGFPGKSRTLTLGRAN